MIVITTAKATAHAGAYVRECRERAGLSIEQAGARVALNPLNAKLQGLTLDLVEQGRHVPSQNFLDRLAKAFPVDPARFRALTAEPASPRFH